MGLFALVLHSHLPYVRRNGVMPCGEDFFHEAAFGCHLPLIEVLSRAPDDVRLTVGVTPILADQWEDSYLLRELRLYLGRVDLHALRIAADREFLDDDGIRAAAGDLALRARRALVQLDELPGGIASGFAALSSAGRIQIAGGPATHPLLSMIDDPAIMRAQIALGAAEHERVFGSRPSAMWMPECAYAPGRGIEAALLAEGVVSTIVDSHLLGAQTLRALRSEGLSVLGIDRTIVDLIWAEGGYPGDPLYRDFAWREFETGFKLWSVSSNGAAVKQPYDPRAARARTAEHAAEFVDALERRFDELAEPDALAVCAVDTELLGHWWLEGPAWLEEVLRLLAGHRTIRTATIDEALSAAPARTDASLPAGTWGVAGDHRSWTEGATPQMWRALAETETQTVRLVASNSEHPAIDQLLREQMLLASSDWTYMVGLNNNARYGRERFDAHLERWRELANAVRNGAEAPWLTSIETVDDPFPDLSAARHAITGGLPSFAPV